MSRIGRKPIEIPKNVKVSVGDSQVHVEGPRGKLSFSFVSRIKVHVKDSVLSVERPTNQKMDREVHGTTRSLIFNMIKGVTDGFQKELAIEGVGFKAQVQGKELQMLLGYTHPIKMPIPEGLTVETPKPTQVVVKGIDKALVGRFASEVRQQFVVEPYKGKGVRYVDEVVRRKAGKTVTK